MAATRMNSRAALGSAQWVKEEREQLARLVDQDVEEFGYSARNELEWLNEHMAEIFSSNQMNVTDVFKTPGKLRGKTPRTARKMDTQRAPLTDLFAPNPQSIMSPARTTPFYQKVSKVNVASFKDSEPAQAGASTRKSPLKQGKENKDSGYHGITEDERSSNALAASPRKALPALPRAPAVQDLLTVEARSTEESFVSAQEGPYPQDLSQQHDPNEDENATIPDEELDQQRAALIANAEPEQQDEIEISIHEDEPNASLEPETETPTLREHTDTASDISSPEKPLLRKSSLNFASLPPRETLTGKRSMGVRNSHFQASQTQGTQPVDIDMDASDREDNDVGTTSTATATHNKTSTQLLQEKISMLGQTREPRTSKSIPSMYPHLSLASQLNKEDHAAADKEDEEEDSWIAPIEDRNSASKAPEQHTQTRPEVTTNNGTQRMYGHQKSISTSNIASPTKSAMRPEEIDQAEVSASVPNGIGNQATTPTSSPKKFTEGPLSASKARFYSVLKSAKGMFATSAGASAHAKMEVSSLRNAASKESLFDNGPDTSKIPGGFADDAASVSTANTAASRPLSAFFSPSKEGRKTRSSTESDKRKKADQKVVDDLDKIRQKERQKATQQRQERERTEAERKAQLDKERVEAAARQEEKLAAAEREQSNESTQEVKAMPSTGRLRAPGRLAKPTRQVPVQSNKPVPVNIRVASQSQRLGSTQPSASNSAPETAQTPGNRPQSAVGRPGLARGGSANPPSAARVKALEAAARKKEQEEKAAARKAEQKKELERKRAAKLEDERRAEQERRAEEQRKVIEARAAAQRQAEQRKLEQQRREAAAAKARADAELAEALERERTRAAATAPQQRGDLPGTMRQLAKSTMVQDMQANKSVKRPLQREADESARTSTMNRGMPSYQQQDAKRRRTDDEEDMDMRERHSVMAPPKRPSNMRKETLMANKFPHGYSHAPPPAAHHAQNNIYKASVTGQNSQPKPGAGPAHPTETIKLSTARIPFADADQPSQPSKTPTATFKTPARPAAPFGTHTKPRSSPAYPNGDSIALPEIHDSDSDDSSDSESESSSNNNAKAAFRAPSWVASPALRDLLTQQQLVDPESVFGPIAALDMDSVFRGGSSKNQERMRRYRERGESALWTESGDAVTSAEKRRDREARERVVRDGGWSFTRDV